MYSNNRKTEKSQIYVTHSQNYKWIMPIYHGKSFCQQCEVHIFSCNVTFKSVSIPPFVHNVWPFFNIMHERVNSFITKDPKIYKAVNWFALQFNRLVSISWKRRHETVNPLQLDWNLKILLSTYSIQKFQTK